MKLRIDLETTIPSDLTALPSRDILKNAALRVRIVAVCREVGIEPPVICTPEELPGNNDDERA